ncbi:MAG: VTT domain-containing protein, partial [Bacteroidota bacterium]
MKEEVLKLFTEHQQLAILLSVVLSIVIAVIGVLPSVFITAANILFFGFWQGILVSFLGEALGAVVSFLLYRKGFKKNVSARLQKFPRVQQLLMAEGNKAFGLIFSLRLLPFVPSGLVTFAAAMGKVSLLVFVVASSVGKIPAL